MLSYDVKSLGKLFGQEFVDALCYHSCALLYVLLAEVAAHCHANAVKHTPIA